VSINYQGKTAVITGASAGIGVEFAHQLASRGANLVLVARREDRLAALSAELGTKYAVAVNYFAIDLSEPTSGTNLIAHLAAAGITTDILINNAGFATHNKVAEEDRTRVQSQIQLNVGTLVDLTIGMLPAMQSQNFGAIVNVASTAALQPVPSLAVYAATKAFVLSFTEALWGELRGTNIKALAICPGATESEFWDVANMDSKSMPGIQTAEQVVTTTLRELDKRKSRPSVISGGINKAQAQLLRVTPKKIVISIAAKLFDHGD
jgi:short-subunit dehydrogenase